MMAAQPYDWNAVVVGAWNLAILTPDGIRKRLLELPDGTPVNLELAVDRPSLFRVLHDDCVVSPTPRRLDVVTARYDRDGLRKAASIATKGVSGLAETPFTAAGVNIRYRVDSFPDELLTLLKTELDTLLSNHEHQITHRSTRRTLSYDDGVAHMDILSDAAGSGTIAFNYHRESGVPEELMSWLGKSEGFLAHATRLMQLLDLPIEGGNDG